MSSRALRKLQAEKIIENVNSSESDENDKDEDDELKSQKINAFDLVSYTISISVVIHCLIYMYTVHTCHIKCC